jgi:hypothetical protein
MRSTVFAAALLVLVAPAFAQRGSPHRCRDRDPACKDWSSRGECEKNHDFMAESCPVSCGYCANAGLLPTPAVFELDFVCNGQLAIAPTSIKGLEDDATPEGCEFRCRNNMTLCGSEAYGSAACKTYPEVMRFQCPQTCGVCKALEMPESSAPKRVCRLETGDEPEFADSCPEWARLGEVIQPPLPRATTAAATRPLRCAAPGR